jgi:YidC/Oxa1 family membrane protein insertase
VSEIWTTFFFQPMLNGLLYLYSLLGHNFALSITVFTVLVRLITLPLTLPQQRSAKKMQGLKPQLDELQKKYKDDKETLTQKQMELYKQHGVNPMSGCLPMLIQFPIWIGLYQSIVQALSNSPLPLLYLSKNIYPTLPHLSSLVPLKDRFLWMTLGNPDPYYVLPVLVAVTMYLQQKLMTTPDGDPQTSSMNQTMQYTMPLMFGFFSLQFASGLSLYFIISAVVGIAIQYVLNNWGELPFQKAASMLETSRLSPQTIEQAGSQKAIEAKKGRRDGSRRKKRKRRR